MAITVSFTGSAAELLELFQSNKFLELILKQGESKDEAKSLPETIESSMVTPSEDKREEKLSTMNEPEKPKISRQQMLHAVQEYAVRMYNRYKESNPDLDVKDMCAQLMLEHTAGTASHTSMVGDLFIEQVYHYAVNDYIPETYKHLIRS